MTWLLLGLIAVLGARLWWVECQLRDWSTFLLRHSTATLEFSQIEMARWKANDANWLALKDWFDTVRADQAEYVQRLRAQGEDV